MGEKGQGDEAVPRPPLPHLVLIQSHLLLGRLEGDLDRPASSRYLHQLLEGGAVRREDDVVGPLRRIFQAAPHQQAMNALGCLPSPQRDLGPLIEPLALAPAPGRESLPDLLGERRRQSVHPHLLRPLLPPAPGR